MRDSNAYYGAGVSRNPKHHKTAPSEMRRLRRHLQLDEGDRCGFPEACPTGPSGPQNNAAATTGKGNDGWSLELTLAWVSGRCSRTALLRAVGFVLKRWTTGERHKERVTELTALTSVASQMREAGVSLAEIEALKTYVRSGRRAEEATHVAVPVKSGPVTQLQINEAAAEALKDNRGRIATSAA